MDLKRPYQVTDDTFARGILENPIKRQKLEEISLLSSKLSTTKPVSEPKENRLDSRFHNRQLHNIPEKSLPIVQHPYHPSDFFTDIDPEMSLKYSQTVSNMVNLFPPPLPPAMPGTNFQPQEGIMIPFIYPPPPVVQPDPYVDDEAVSGHNKRANRSSSQPVTLAPLPFPPKNFMPYPLDASKSTLLPQQVFGDFLDASTVLPRTDMVVASAAGSLADMKHQAVSEGFSVDEYNISRSLKKEALLYDRSTEEERGSYYDNINVLNQYDRTYKGIYDPNDRASTAVPPMVEVQAETSDIKNEPEHGSYSSSINYREKVESKLPQLQQLLGTRPSIQRANERESLNKKKDIIVASVYELEKYDRNNKKEALAIQEQQVLAKLEGLQKTKILLTDHDNLHIKDEQIIKMKQDLGISRDLELVRLKIESNYEVLRQLTSFYSESNKAYRKYQGVITNKMLKLKNFLEYQKNFFEKLLKSNRGLADYTDLNNKESTRLFNDAGQRDYASELKELLKLKLAQVDDPEASSDDKIDRLVEQLEVNNFSGTLEILNDVNDFMPLITSREFDLITSNLKQKNELKLNANLKHEIFQSPLYASGSESSTMYSSSTPAPDTPKRRGRRSNLEVDEENLSSETFLLAKILKHFVGPQSVNNDQMAEDFDSMGITSKWD